MNGSTSKLSLLHVQYVVDNSIHILQCDSVCIRRKVSDTDPGIFLKKKSTDFNTCEIFVNEKIADNKDAFSLFRVYRIIHYLILVVDGSCM